MLRQLRLSWCSLFVFHDYLFRDGTASEYPSVPNLYSVDTRFKPRARFSTIVIEAFNGFLYFLQENPNLTLIAPFRSITCLHLIVIFPSNSTIKLIVNLRDRLHIQAVFSTKAKRKM
jgi:hypothetical protein